MRTIVRSGLDARHWRDPHTPTDAGSSLPGGGRNLVRPRARRARPTEPTMLLHLSRASFWLAALAAAWVLVAPGQHGTALTGAAGAAALIAFVLWRCAL